MRIVIALLLLLALTQAAYDWTEVEQVIAEGINDGIFSGGALAVATGNATLFKKAYGTVGPKRGFYSPPITVDMKFDIGSLTEPIGINSALM
jgi:CubicO group peptidase (beta-lactamase class C family)